MPSPLLVLHLLAQMPAPQSPEPLPHPELPAPLQIAPGLSWWVYAGIAIVLLAIIGMVLIMVLSKKSAQPSVPKRPLHEALRTMKALRNKADVLPPAEVGHSVSEILRLYYFDRYGIPAPFKTTEELFPYVTRNDEPMRRRNWRERFESLAAIYDSLSYMPPPFSKTEAIALVDSAIAKLEEERLLHEDPLAV